MTSSFEVEAHIGVKTGRFRGIDEHTVSYVKVDNASAQFAENIRIDQIGRDGNPSLPLLLETLINGEVNLRSE